MTDIESVMNTTGLSHKGCGADHCSKSAFRPRGEDICLKCTVDIESDFVQLREDVKSDEMKPSAVESEIENILNAKGVDKDQLPEGCREEIRTIVQQLQ